MSYDVSQVSTGTTLSTSSVSSATTSTAAAEAQEQKDMFLKILLTQLETQNPLDPVDTTEFTSQLAQYSSIEQQIETNEKLQEISDMISGSGLFSATSYLGAEVSINDDSSVVQDSTASWSYALANDAESVVLTLTDSDGNVLQEISLADEAAGTYELNIDAAELGVSEGDIVNLSVSAENFAGEAVSSQTSAKLRVDSVETDGNGEITLQAGDYIFSADLVTAYKQTT